MAKKAVTDRGVCIRAACEAFGISESCYRYERKLDAENDEVANWLIKLTDNHRNWGFGLCYLYLRNVKGFKWNHKRVYRIYKELELNLRIKPRKRLVREKPEVIRCDNGPEYISTAIQTWAQEWGIRLEYIQPGNPQQNAYVERFNRTVRYEWLSQYYWSDLTEVQDFATKWMWSYNHDRPNKALGGFTPKQRLAMAA